MMLINRSKRFVATAVILSITLLSCAEPQWTRGERENLAGEISELELKLTGIAATETPLLTQTSLPPTNTTEPTPPPSETPATESVPTAVSTLAKLTVSVGAANVRDGPGTDNNVIGTIRGGEYVDVLGLSLDAGWYEVILPTGITGWVGRSIAIVSDVESVNMAQSDAEAAIPATNTVEVAQQPTAEPTSAPPTATQQVVSGEQLATVTQIIDGDTIEVNLDGGIYRVRYIGIDSAEYDQPCGSEATQANTNLVAGKTVSLVKDVSETDRYGRLLRYVYVDGLFVNAELVRQGWAVAVQYPPDTSQAAYLESQMAGAPVHNCALPTATFPPPPPPEQPPQGNCHPSYPTVCIPPPPPDLDCGDISYRRFQVTGDDPHRFDGDHDGVGCESG